MSAKVCSVPQANPDKHLFMGSSEGELHEIDATCWCRPILIVDPDDKSGKDWVWFHRVLN